MDRLVDRRPAVSPERLIAQLVPPPTFTEVSFDSYRPDPAEPTQAAAVASLEDAPAHLPQRIAEASAERERMADGLRALGLEPLPSSANFLFVDVGDDEAKAIDAALTRRGVIVRPTAGFGAHGGLRITVGLPEQTDRLLVAMAEALQEIR